MPKRKANDLKARRHERSISSYNRRPGRRSPGQCILVVCEGAETEPNYFSSLREYLKLSTINIKIIDRAGAPISVVDEARAQVKKREQDIHDRHITVPPFEAVWCVFDVENPHHNQTFDRAVHIADQNEFQLAISNPAFEFWYVLHFKPTTHPFANGDELKEYLKRHISDYHPSRPVFDRIVAFTQMAIQNAKGILKNHPQGKQRFPNPSTRVHLLVEEMVEMSPSGRQHFR